MPTSFYRLKIYLQLRRKREKEREREREEFNFRLCLNNGKSIYQKICTHREDNIDLNKIYFKQEKNII